MKDLTVRFEHGYPGFGLEVDLHLPSRGVTAIFGPSGSGKTTLLRLIAGLERAADGYLSVADAVWQDGQPVTAKDVVYTFGLIQDRNYPGPGDLAALWRSVKVDALDAKTVRFTLSEPYAPFLDFLSTGLLPEHLLAGVGVKELDTLPFNLKPVGSGPFAVETVIVEGESIRGVTLRPSGKYYGSKALLDRVDVLYYPTQSDAFAALEKGDATGLGGLSVDELNAALKNPKYRIYTARLPQSSLIFLNLKNTDVGFFAQREIRKALLSAIDRQRIIDNVLGGQAVPAVGPILPGSWAEDPNLQPLAYDPGEAARLLEQASQLAEGNQRQLSRNQALIKSELTDLAEQGHLVPDRPFCQVGQLALDQRLIA